MILKKVIIPDLEKESGAEDALGPEDVRFEAASILVVDDQPLNRRLLKEYLSGFPFQIIEAANGKEAVEMAEQYHPHLILMDAQMPVMNGGEAMKILKKHDELKQIPIIIVTASVFREQREALLQEGGEGFLDKPVSKNRLMAQLKRFLRYSAILPPTDTEGEYKITKTGTTTNADLQDPAHLPELLALLQRKKVASQWKSLRKTMIFDEVESFIEIVKALDGRFSNGLLTHWADRMAADLSTFDLNRIRDTLDDFPHVLKQLENLSGGGPGE